MRESKDTRQVNATHDFELELFTTKDIPGITDEN